MNVPVTIGWIEQFIDSGIVPCQIPGGINYRSSNWLFLSSKTRNSTYKARHDAQQLAFTPGAMMTLSGVLESRAA